VQYLFIHSHDISEILLTVALNTINKTYLFKFQINKKLFFRIDEVIDNGSSTEDNLYLNHQHKFLNQDVLYPPIMMEIPAFVSFI
jgi:hypothetical protein